MPNKIDHIGIAVPNLDAAASAYKDLKFHFDHIETVEEQKVRVAFFHCGESHIELLEPTAEDSPIAKYIAKKGGGIHHLCVEVDNLEEALQEYAEKGVRLINEKPVIGAGGCRVAFVHPKSTHGVLLELKEKE
ncbi:MAG: methylmalonyl-CoA epimerase [Acidobacteria bacterium]|nr:MAG: methylmalonyl-CoA epimerase [Acidobacteriota bacterium]PIE88940.1 MAG: methylmalonyl-CoA epimerase [Acidobacteriota bacterium]